MNLSKRYNHEEPKLFKESFKKTYSQGNQNYLKSFIKFRFNITVF